MSYINIIVSQSVGIIIKNEKESEVNGGDIGSFNVRIEEGTGIYE